MDGNPLYRASDIGTLLDMRAVRSVVRNFSDKEKVICKSQTSGGSRDMLYLTYAGVRRLLARSRKPAAAGLAQAFGMVVHDNHYVTIEAAALKFIMTAFSGLQLRQQYCVGPYRIDLYFPDQRLAVECDEEGAHGPGIVSQDHERQRFLETMLACTFVRFRPQEKGFCVAKLVNTLARGLGLF